MTLMTPERINQIIQGLQTNPDNYQVLERIPYTLINEQTPLPIRFYPLQGDEIPLVILDTETTGLKAESDHIIELAMLKVLYSPKLSRIVQIDSMFDQYEDPGVSITPIITKITGITNEMVQAQHIDDNVVGEFVLNGNPQGVVPIIVAHNAQFDRKFMDKRFECLEKLPWACSINDVNWSSLGFGSSKQELIAYKLGYFYEAHRAITDTLALTFILNAVPKSLENIMTNVKRKTYSMEIFNSFSVKDDLKKRGFSWNNNNKSWAKVNLSEKEKDEIYAFLQDNNFDDNNINMVAIDASERYGFNDIVIKK